MFKFVSNYLKPQNLLSSQNSADTCMITRFKLVSEVDFPEEINDDLLRNVIVGGNNYLEELDLCIKPVSYTYINPYKSCFETMPAVLNSRSLTFLTLKRLKLARWSPVSLPSLKAKHSSYDNSVQDLISGGSARQKMLI